MSPVELLPGTLDLLILKAVSLRPEHGYVMCPRSPLPWQQ